MTRKFSLLIIIALFLAATIGASAFAAKATSGTKLTGDVTAKAWGQDRFFGGNNDPMSQGVGFPSKPSNSYYNSSLGFNTVGISITITGATSQYDLNANNTLPTTIDEQNGNIMGLYMNLQPAANRLITQYYYTPGSAVPAPFDISGTGGGFPSMNGQTNGIGIGAWHRVASGGTQVGEDNGAGVGSYSIDDYTPNVGAALCGPFTASDGEYIWPSMALDYPSGGGGAYQVHVVAHESPDAADTTGYQSMVYYRSGSGTVADADGPLLVDCVGLISGCMVQDPNSDKVAIVWGIPRSDTDVLFANDDVAYVESASNGDDWISGGFPAPTIIHSFTNDDLPDGVGGIVEGYWERAWETTALYSSDGCLNVLFQSTWSDTGFSTVYGDGGFVLVFPGAVYHWSDCNGGSVKITDDNLYGHGCGGLGVNAVSMRNTGKLNLSECSSTGNLYATYNRSFADIEVQDPIDCSAGASGFPNLEIVIRASSTGGLTWGNEINITETTSPGCTPGNCFSETHLGTVRYNSDSITVAFMEDKDAGISINSNGVATSNPIKNIRLACYEMQEFVDLNADPGSFTYPFNTQPSVATPTQTSTITNLGNAAVTPNVNVNYISGGGWLNITSGATLNVPVGFSNTNDLTFVATGPGTEGLYQAIIEIPYDDGSALAAPVTLEIPVDLYNFNDFCLPENALLRTLSTRMAVNQASEVADDQTGSAFTYFSDEAQYAFDGHLVMGNSAADLTYSTFGGGGGTSTPTVDNPFGFLYAIECPLAVNDSVTFAGSPTFYRYAQGKGVNRDTTIEFISTYYASSIPGDDASEFYILKYQIYAGSNFGGDITGLNIGYYIDWDVPSDSGNNSETDAGKYALVQQGTYADNNRWAAMSAYTPDGGAVAGVVVDNPSYIYPESGWENDSLWAWLDNTDGRLADGTFSPADSTEDDLSSLIIGYRNATLGANDTLVLCVFLAGEDDDASGGVNSDDILETLDEAVAFACDENRDFCPGASFCAGCECGDADGNGQVTISDAVYIINFIFGGGPAPDPLCNGDADGNGQVTISDAVYIINFIFGGGPPPGGCS